MDNFMEGYRKSGVAEWVDWTDAIAKEVGEPAAVAH